MQPVSSDSLRAIIGTSDVSVRIALCLLHCEGKSLRRTVVCLCWDREQTVPPAGTVILLGPYRAGVQAGVVMHPGGGLAIEFGSPGPRPRVAVDGRITLNQLGARETRTMFDDRRAAGSPARSIQYDSASTTVRLGTQFGVRDVAVALSFCRSRA